MTESRLQRLTLGGRLAPAAGAILLVSLWLPWFGTAPEDDPFIPPARKVTIDAWQSFGSIDLVLALTALVAIGVSVPALSREHREPGNRELAPVFALALISAALIVYRLFEPIQNTIVHYGAAVGLAAVIAIAVGSLPGALYVTARVRRALMSLPGPPPGSRGP